VVRRGDCGNDIVIEQESSLPSTNARSSGKELFWERYFVVYDTLNLSPLYRRLVMRHVELLEPASGDAILDVGAGTGNVTRLLAVPGARVIGVDFCAPALERCRQKVPSAEFRHADLTEPLPFESASFDKIACSVTLHFLEPERQQFALTELLRVLRPGGRLALSVFNDGFNPLRVYWETLRELVRNEGLLKGVQLALRCLVDTILILYYQWRIKMGERAGIHRYFTTASLRRMLESVGFSAITIETVYADQCLMASAAKPASLVETLRETARSGVSAL
jgi:ubiquinone/menaquinone biosynthesis C-methylase UbiE